MTVKKNDQTVFACILNVETIMFFINTGCSPSNTTLIEATQYVEIGECYINFLYFIPKLFCIMQVYFFRTLTSCDYFFSLNV